MRGLSRDLGASKDLKDAELAHYLTSHLLDYSGTAIQSGASGRSQRNRDDRPKVSHCLFLSVVPIRFPPVPNSDDSMLRAVTGSTSIIVHWIVPALWKLTAVNFMAAKLDFVDLGSGSLPTGDVSYRHAHLHRPTEITRAELTAVNFR